MNCLAKQYFSYQGRWWLIAWSEWMNTHLLISRQTENRFWNKKYYVMLFHQFIMSTIEIYVTQVSINNNKKKSKISLYHTEWDIYMNVIYKDLQCEKMLKTQKTHVCVYNYHGNTFLLWQKNWTSIMLHHIYGDNV